MKPSSFEVMRRNRRHAARRAVHTQSRDLIEIAQAFGIEDSEMLIEALGELEHRRELARQKVEMAVQQKPVSRWWHLWRTA